MIIGLRLAQMWNVPRLFSYCVDHLKRKVEAEAIHPAIVLAVARASGLPSLVKPAVKQLAELKCSLYSWCCEREVLQYVTVDEVGAIARMKERLYMARLAFVDVPPATHSADCANTAVCTQAWNHYWHTVVGKKLRKLDDASASYQLLRIRSTDVVYGQVPAMGDSCRLLTTEKVASHDCWFADDAIVKGAVECLMVPERTPDWPYNA